LGKPLRRRDKGERLATCLSREKTTLPVLERKERTKNLPLKARKAKEQGPFKKKTRGASDLGCLCEKRGGPNVRGFRRAIPEKSNKKEEGNEQEGRSLPEGSPGRVKFTRERYGRNLKSGGRYLEKMDVNRKKKGGPT